MLEQILPPEVAVVEVIEVDIEEDPSGYPVDDEPGEPYEEEAPPGLF